MKKATATQEAPVAVPAIRILKIASCPTLSGKSTLGYCLGCTDESEGGAPAIYLRIHANDGGGLFSNEWIPYQAIQQVLEKHPADKPITSFILHSLFKGRSANNRSFLLAILTQEKLVKQSADKQRQYERIDPAEFIAEVGLLMASGIDLKVDDKAVAATGKKAASPSKHKNG
jgi:hypothetical protein